MTIPVGPGQPGGCINLELTLGLSLNKNLVSFPGISVRDNINRSLLKTFIMNGKVICMNFSCLTEQCLIIVWTGGKMLTEATQDCKPNV